MRLRIGVVSILSATIGLCACVSEAREWADVTGRYKVEATFVGFKDGKVRLKKPSGDMVAVPLVKLREEDQKFVMVQVMLHAKEAATDSSDAPAESSSTAAATPSPTPAATPSATSARSTTSIKATTSTASTTATASTTSTTPQEEMFTVVKTEMVEKPVEVNGCRVAPKNGCVLCVCTVNFTKAGLALSHEALNKLKIDTKSKNLSKKSTKGNVISKGDFCFRLDNDAIVACYCLPATDAAPGLPVRPPRARGGENWLMYCGNVRLLASVKPDVKPESLVWGATYEAKVVPPGPAAAKQPQPAAAPQPPKTAVPQPQQPTKVSAGAGGAPAAKAAPVAPKPTVAAGAAQAKEKARQQQIARREATLNNGVLRGLLGKYPELESMNIGPQLADMDELWDGKDQFKQAAFDAFVKRMRGGK
jgi:hypothetical protein